MRRYLYIAAFSLLCHSCVVSSKQMANLESKLDANSIVIENQNRQIETLKEQANDLRGKNASLTSDTLRLNRQIREIEAKYDKIIESGANSTIIANRRVESAEESMRRKNDKLAHVKSTIDKHKTTLNYMEQSITGKLNSYFYNDVAALYQTKTGINIEIADSRILSDSTLIDTANLFIGDIMQLLESNNDFNVTIDSYFSDEEIIADIDTAVDNEARDSLTSDNSNRWAMSLERGVIFANMFIENGLEASRIEVVAHTIDYPLYKIVYDDSPSRVIIELNLDSEAIIEVFESITN